MQLLRDKYACGFIFIFSLKKSDWNFFKQVNHSCSAYAFVPGDLCSAAICVPPT